MLATAFTVPPAAARRLAVARTPTLSREAQGLALGLFAATVWGACLVVTRQGLEAGLASTDLAFLRYAVAGVVLAPWLMRNNPGALAGVGWQRGLVLALLAGPLFALAGASGLRFAPLAHGAVVQPGVLTLTAVALSAALAGERPNRSRLAGLAVIAAGLVCVAGPQTLCGGSDAWKGDLLFAAAGAMWALYTVLQRHWGIDALAAVAVVSVLSAAIYAPIYFAAGGGAALVAADPLLVLRQAAVLGLLGGVVSLLAFARAVALLGPARAALFPALAPAVAMLIGAATGAETPGCGQLGGLAALTAGLALSLRAGAPVSGGGGTRTG